MGVISLPELCEGGIVHWIAEKQNTPRQGQKKPQKQALGTPPDPPSTHRPENHIDGGETAAPAS
jgi:hypothetical protein